MAVLDTTQYAVRTERPRTNIWSWVLGAYSHYRDDDTATIEWQTDGSNTIPASAIDPLSLVAAGYILEYRGNTPEIDGEHGRYVEIYRKFGTKTAY